MSVESGRLISGGIAKETVRGTAVTPAYWLPQTTIDFQNKVKLVQEDSVFGVLNKYQRTDVVERWAEGKIGGYLGDASAGLLLFAALGTLTSHAAHPSETVVYDNIFNQSQSNIPQSLTVTRKDTISDYRYARAMLKTLELDVAVGEYVKYNSDWVGTFSNSGVSDTVAYVAENRFRPKHATVKMATLTSGLSGATAIPIKSLKITITRTINPYFVFGSNDVNEIYVEDFTVTGDCTLLYDSTQTYETLYYNDTQQAMSIDLKNSDITIGTASSPELILTLPQLTLNTWTINQGINNMTEQTFGFQGQYNLTAGQEITATMTNTVNGY